MKQNIRFIALAAVGAIALLMPLNAHAICGTDTSFGGYYSLVAGTTHGASLRSSFWTLNSGSTTNGAGNDNGSISDDLWVIPYNGGFISQGGWAQQTYDGCPDLGGAAPTQRMVFAYSDIGAGGVPTYAVECVHRDVTAGRQFNTDLPPGCDAGSCQPIALVPIPKGQITNTVRAGTEAQVTVASPNFAPGFYTDGSTGCDVATVIPQYDVYRQQTARDVAPSAGRDVGATWVLVGTGNTGTPFSFTTACGATNCDIFVAVAPHYNNNFSTGEPSTGAPNRVGADSTKIHAGPTLAVTPKSKVITNKKNADQ